MGTKLLSTFCLFFLLATTPILANENLIALTFDDGPTRYTNYILDVLEAHNSHATFFVVGTNVERNPHILQRIANQGHEIGNHTWNHEQLITLRPAEIKRTIRQTSTAVRDITGSYPTLFRPPYGSFDLRERTLIRWLGYPIIMWSVDTRDWESRNSNTIFNHIVSNAEHGAIILMHDTHRSTYEAVARAIPHLIDQGFTLVTVSDLLGNTVAGNVYR